jgi:hypothetical protein
MGSAMTMPQGGDGARRHRHRQFHAELSPWLIRPPRDPPQRGKLETPLAAPLTRREPNPDANEGTDYTD